MPEQLTYMLLKRKQSQNIKAYAVLCLILLLLLGGYSYKKWQEYSLVNLDSTNGKSYISRLSDQVSSAKTDYELNKSNYDDLNLEIEENLEHIFPIGDEYTDLTRELDSYEEDLSTKSNTFEVSSINFESVKKEDHYSILPVRMSIKSSAGNFKKFLHLVENSGALSGYSRLMDISSIRLSFEKNDKNKESKEEIINFTVQLNAYFQ